MCPQPQNGTSGFCSQSTHGCSAPCPAPGCQQGAHMEAELTWPRFRCRNRTSGCVSWCPTLSAGSARRPAGTPSVLTTTSRQLTLPLPPTSVSTPWLQGSLFGTRNAHRGTRPWGHPCHPKEVAHTTRNPAPQPHPNPNLTSSSGPASSTGGRMESWRTDAPLWCWTDTLPRFGPCRHLGRPRNKSGTFPS